MARVDLLCLGGMLTRRLYTGSPFLLSSSRRSSLSSNSINSSWYFGIFHSGCMSLTKPRKPSSAARTCRRRDARSASDISETSCPVSGAFWFLDIRQVASDINEAIMINPRQKMMPICTTDFCLPNHSCALSKYFIMAFSLNDDL